MKNLTKCVITLFACLSLIGLYGDENGFKNRMSSAFDEVSLASLPIIVVDAVNGAPVIDAEVKIGSSPVMTTNADGKVFFKADQDGTYDVEIKKHGYIRMLSTVEMQAGSIFGNANVFAVSKLLPLDHIRIVLEWGDKPRDLDLHLIKKESCHISYRNKRTSRDRRIKLDRDDRNGYGPETITIKKVKPNDEFRIYVHNYSKRRSAGMDTFLGSNAVISVYMKNRLAARYSVPRGRGAYWNVLDIKNSQLISNSYIYK